MQLGNLFLKQRIAQILLAAFNNVNLQPLSQLNHLFNCACVWQSERATKRDREGKLREIKQMRLVFVLGQKFLRVTLGICGISLAKMPKA